VGSLVAFVDGAPFKAGYRRFRIAGVEGVDDFASLREVTRRRFDRLAREEHVFPDVYLVDGGIGQISSVAKELENFKPRPHLLSLAKREETLYRWTGSRAEEVRLEKSAPALRLLMYVRDEAHRFAQHYHHLLRRKAIMDEAAR